MSFCLFLVSQNSDALALRSYIQQHGDDASYPARNIRPRYLLGIRDADTPQSQRIYDAQLRIWKQEKKEGLSRAKEDEWQHAVEQAWAELEDAKLVEQMKHYVIM